MESKWMGGGYFPWSDLKYIDIELLWGTVLESLLVGFAEKGKKPPSRDDFFLKKIITDI
jgi:hypothetical protein